MVRLEHLAADVLGLGPVELGLAFLGRYQSMDQSAAVGGQFVYGFDSGFHGLLLSAGVRF